MCVYDLPTVVRARGLYIYDEKGKRYLDFYLDKGRLALGHRIPHQLQLIKSVLARGLYADYPCVYEQRLKKAFLAFFAQNIVVHGFREAHLAQAFLKEKYGCSFLPYSWQEEARRHGRARWTLGAPIEDPLILLWEMEPPLPSFLGYIRFFVEKKLACQSSLQLWGNPWDPFTLRLSEQVLHALIRERCSAFVPPASHIGEGLWKRQKQVWTPLYEKSHHYSLWQSFKAKGVLLPPSHEVPLLISRSLQKHDWKLFEKAQRAYLEKHGRGAL